MNLTRIIAGVLLCITAAFAELPPIIDRELLFDDPEISSAQISPDGKYIAFMKPLNKTRNIWVKKTAEPFSAAKPVTSDKTRPIPAYFWSRDSKYILYVQDNAGDENFNVFAVNPGDPAPTARNITDAKGVQAQLYAVPKSDPDILFIGLNDRDKAWHDLYKLKISTGERTLLRKNTDRIASWIFDTKDQLRAALRSAENGSTELLRVDPDGFHMIYSCDILEGCGPLHFHPDNQRIYMDTNHGADVDLGRLTLLQLKDGKEELVESDPKGRVDFGQAIFSDLTDKLLATVYVDEKVRIYWKDKAYEADYNWLKTRLPGKEVNFGSHTTDERLWIISASSDTEPGETYLFDRTARKLTLQYRVRDKINRDSLAHMEPIHYPSSDGLDISAYLTVPKGVPAKNLPLIVFPHGGPWARDMWGYSAYPQFLANRGYAVLQPNFRASTGYGKKFLNAGNLEWGRKMQDDLTWGVKYLIANGTVNPKRVGIMGGSYGGYATLAGVTFTPDLYAAAVAIVAPSNLTTLLDSIPAYWEAGRKTMYARMGDPNTAEGKAALDRESPLRQANRIKTPLMVVQGANDPRVNKAEADQIVIALRDRHFPVEYLVAPDEGHGFRRPVNNMAMLAASEKFLAKYLDGRSQESMTPEVAERLKAITVDPATVVLAKKMDAAQVGVPKLAVPLTAGVYKYKARIELQGQTIPLEMTTEVKEDPQGWAVSDRMGTPMGEVVDSSILDKETLSPINRLMKQGPSTIAIDYKGNKATGKMSMNGKDVPIDVDLGGPLFADAAASAQSIACLPLADGYSTAFRAFDLQKQKAKFMRLEVKGSEQVTVPAGSFDAYKAELAPADGSPGTVTIWIDKSSRKAVKVAAVMAQMGGAIMTAELQ